MLYISVEYATAVHSCCCGCGDRVVTPFTPTDWRITFDGESVSLDPSVGNWNQKCRSHYVIRRNRVLEAGPWSNAQVEAERRRDKKAKAAYFGKTADAQPSVVTQAADRVPSTTAQETNHSSRGVWARIKSWLTR